MRGEMRVISINVRIAKASWPSELTLIIQNDPQESRIQLSSGQTAPPASGTNYRKFDLKLQRCRNDRKWPGSMYTTWGSGNACVHAQKAKAKINSREHGIEFGGSFGSKRSGDETRHPDGTILGCHVKRFDPTRYRSRDSARRRRRLTAAIRFYWRALTLSRWNLWMNTLPRIHDNGEDRTKFNQSCQEFT